jgi:hypothetical protein
MPVETFIEERARSTDSRTESTRAIVLPDEATVACASDWVLARTLSVFMPAICRQRKEKFKLPAAHPLHTRMRESRHQTLGKTLEG